MQSKRIKNFTPRPHSTPLLVIEIPKKCKDPLVNSFPFCALAVKFTFLKLLVGHKFRSAHLKFGNICFTASELIWGKNGLKLSTPTTRCHYLLSEFYSCRTLLLVRQISNSLGTCIWWYLMNIKLCNRSHFQATNCETKERCWCHPQFIVIYLEASCLPHWPNCRYLVALV